MSDRNQNQNKSFTSSKDSTNASNPGAKPDHLSGRGANNGTDSSHFLRLPRRESDREDALEPACRHQQTDWEKCIEEINDKDASFFQG